MDMAVTCKMASNIVCFTALTATLIARYFIITLYKDEGSARLFQSVALGLSQPLRLGYINHIGHLDLELLQE